MFSTENEPLPFAEIYYFHLFKSNSKLPVFHLYEININELFWHFAKKYFFQLFETSTSKWA